MSRRAVFIPIAMILAWWAISMSRSLIRPSEQNPGREPAAAEASGPKTPQASLGTETPQSPKKTLLAAPMGGEYRPLEHERELKSYLDLRAKVMMTEAERALRADLLRHSGFIRELGSRLRETSLTPLLVQEQDAAIDLLFDALKDGDSSLAGELLRDVVQDAQVENSSLDRGVREQLAGIKAEVLYQWSAVSPQMAADLGRWLPGPVSQKIWDNVVRRQEANLAESKEEAAGLSP